MKKNSTLVILAIFLILTGILVTLENYGLIHNVSRHWPVLLLFMGGGFLLLFFDRGRADPVLLWLGAFQVLLGVFFYFLNAISWRSLASLWPVFLGVVGFSFLLVAVFSKKMLYIYLAGGFIILFIIFTLVFSISSRLWPLSFVVFGISLLIIEYIINRSKK